ncbi:hypothetical protein GCM10011387_22490 [Pedobacter quisquiliarum]|uniref:DUF2306 domain-containing protein n=1 Tax=Pedobacter quisquiliarum TaxID=1834438 RepID=A0A916XES0_9SPHI|nr:hypothetical protein [Pedobacter quisquiliarum]GGC68580.1 hypothetical protein GCM10011387_22490 [Pedobacter quisquiliarum]
MEQAIKTLIYVHAFFGGIGLITGIISILVRKGGIKHKNTGKIFSYAMIISSLVSLFIARMPAHENLFLFLIGIFTIYLVLAGNRALTLKDKTKTEADLLDKSISGTMLLASIIMLVIGVIGQFQHHTNSILFTFFGAIGIFMTLKDFQTFRTFTQKKNAWLISHLGRMIGGLIASFTAFLVAGLHLSTLIIWIMPTVIGTAYIIYWNRKFRSNPNSAASA